MTQEALKLALEALEVATTPLAKDRQEVLRAITAINEVLANHIEDNLAMVAAQPEQDTIQRLSALARAQQITIEKLEQALAQTQEPVAQPASEEDMKIYKTIAANYHKDLSTPPQRTEPLTDDLYNELLFAVGNKCPNETRHQTALRYILQAEKGDEKAAHGIKGDA